MRRALIFANTFVTGEVLWSRDPSDSRAESILGAPERLNHNLEAIRGSGGTRADQRDLAGWRAEPTGNSSAGGIQESNRPAVHQRLPGKWRAGEVGAAVHLRAVREDRRDAGEGSAGKR